MASIASFVSMGIVLLWRITGVCGLLSCYECSFDPQNPQACLAANTGVSVVCPDITVACSVSVSQFRHDPTNATSDHTFITRQCGMPVTPVAQQLTSEFFQDARFPGMVCATVWGQQAEAECWCMTDNCNAFHGQALVDSSIFRSEQNVLRPPSTSEAFTTGNSTVTTPPGNVTSAVAATSASATKTPASSVKPTSSAFGMDYSFCTVFLFFLLSIL